jgi:hypothetical protein
VFLSALVLSVALVAASGGVGGTDHRPVTGTTQLGDTGIEPDGVLLRAEVRDDGSARWTVEYRVRLNDANTTAAFESLRSDIERNGTAYTATFAERMRATADAAENATGREMAVRDVSVRTARQQLPQEYGVVTYRFEWVGFAETTAGELVVGDALAGLFLDRQTTLVVAWPDAYAPTRVSPDPDERRDAAVAWVGPLEFDAGQPTVALSTDAVDGRTDTASGVGDGAGGAGDDGARNDAGTPLLPALGVVALLAGVAVAVVWWRSRDRDAVVPSPGAGGGDVDGEAAAGRPDEPAGTTPAPPADGTGTDDGPAGDTGDAAEPWADELLSNEERVELLLEHNDGRMKQQAIASELEWSDAKTSQVIGKMRDADAVETFRLGRENVVSLPDRELA